LPLNVASLQSDLEALFSNPPLTAAECAQAWANAVQAYASGVVPASTTVSAAASTLATALQSAFGTPNALTGFDTAFLTLAATVASGMLPTFVGVPPAAALGIDALFDAPQASHGAAAGTFASHIDVWLRTATASLVLPPFTSTTWT